MKSYIDEVLHFDKRSKEDVLEFEATGLKSRWLEMMEANGFFTGGKIMPLVDIINCICDGDLSKEEMVFQFEAVACDLSQIAVFLGKKI